MTLLVLSKITLCFWSLPDRFIYRLIYILNNSKWTSTFKCFTLLSLRRTQQEARLTHMPTLHHCQLRDNFILLTNIKDFFFLNFNTLFVKARHLSGSIFVPIGCQIVNFLFNDDVAFFSYTHQCWGITSEHWLPDI